MDQRCNQNRYTINPETRWKIKVGTQTWKRLATKYYMIDGSFRDQLIPDSRTYRTNKVWDENTSSMKTAMKPKHTTLHKRVGYSKGEWKYLIVWSKTWNEHNIEYEWNGHKFGKKRQQLLPEFMNTVKKRRETQRANFFRLFDDKVPECRLSDVIELSLEDALTYYHTLNDDMYKEWMNEKRLKKDFCTQKDDEEGVGIASWRKERRGSGIIDLDDGWDWWVPWNGEEVYLEWDAWLFPVFHHNHGIQFDGELW